MEKGFVENVVAEMLAAAAIREQRLKCACETPIPGVFDQFDYTTCQKCECVLSRLSLVDRTVKTRHENK